MKNPCTSTSKKCANQFHTFAFESSISYKTSRSLKCVMLIIALCTFVTAKSQAQSNAASQIVSGIVRSSDDNTTLPGTSIQLKGSSEGTISDGTGKFEFPKALKKGDVLVFSFVGFELKEFVVTENLNGFIEISLIPTVVEVMGDVATDAIYTEPINTRKWVRKN
jgi:hypothetical protein